MMDVLELIKSRRTIRRYQDKPVPQVMVKKIIEAGIWGPSLLAPGFQPWVFIPLVDQALIKRISGIMLERSKSAGVLGRRILTLSAETIANAKTVIAVYNCSCLAKFTEKITKPYVKYAKAAELSAISAAIQNMVLTAESFGIGSSWHDTPLFCEKGINQLLNTDNKLVAVLTFGYPAETGQRARRKPLAEAVHYQKFA
ncbi:nitroreductase family protein [Candidatus Omnitrophota bacterium]